MKWFMIILLAVLGIQPLAEAKVKSKSVSAKKLEKNMSFNDRLVKGKHQIPGEGIVTVENEKPLINFLSIRSDFKDRREKERLRN